MSDSANIVQKFIDDLVFAISFVSACAVGALTGWMIVTLIHAATVGVLYKDFDTRIERLEQSQEVGHE